MMHIANYKTIDQIHVLPSSIFSQQIRTFSLVNVRNHSTDNFVVVFCYSNNKPHDRKCHAHLRLTEEQHELQVMALLEPIIDKTCRWQKNLV